MTPTRRVAAFDFDGTLTPRDTFLPFLQRLYGRRRLVTSAAVVGPPWRVPSETHRRDEMKARLLRRLTAGDDPARIERVGIDYAALLERVLVPAMVERVAQHQRSGHEVVAVSASMSVYLRPLLVDRLGFDAVLAVGLEVGADGRHTGEMLGPNVHGPQKAIELRRWLGEGGADDRENQLELWAYGNSSGDAELLAMADHPTSVAGRRPIRLTPLA